jgi:RecA-family ATPase
MTDNDYSNIARKIASNLLTAEQLLEENWPEPTWAVPGILPVGLNLLAGPPKVGKSWLALQIAQAVSTGGTVLDERVEQGSVLYLALEDPPRRMHDRMKKQGWTRQGISRFLTLGRFQDAIGDLSKAGGRGLAQYVRSESYRLLVIDTFSRAFSGDQNEVDVMTSVLVPIQQLAHEHNCAVLLIDHHRKATGEAHDPIADVIGGTAKGAMADTILGLYHERGKTSAHLTITGREVAYKSLDIYMDWMTGVWQMAEGEHKLSPEQRRTYNTLRSMIQMSNGMLAKDLQRHPGSVLKDLNELHAKGLVVKLENGNWKVVE